jgi:hypothetical protein
VTIRRQQLGVKSEFPSGIRRFSPDDPPPTSRAATRDLPAALREAPSSAIRYRVRILWDDDSAPTGRREEIFEFGDVRRALDLVRRVDESPERPVLSKKVEAFVRPRWHDVHDEFLRWRAAQRDRRDQLRAVMARRAAEHISRKPGGAR